MNTTTTEEEDHTCCNCMMLLNDAMIETRFIGGESIASSGMCDTAKNIATTFHRIFNQVKGVDV